MALSDYRYRINGALNTGDNVLANMEKLANSCATWISYDMFTGKWDVVINKPSDTVMAFNDNNIIGGITLNGSGLRDMYNSVEVKFPHSDLNNQMDYIRIASPSEDRLPNEPDNTLTIVYDLLNDPVQAQYLGLVELKQSRLDKIAVFKSDYSMVNLAAGAVISITNSMYGWTAKLFRIITIKEVTDSGALCCEITALEYNVNVFDTTDLTRYIRTNANGILDIGAIGIPTAPIITKYQTDARPSITVEAEVPGGVVSGIEYWLTYDTTVGSDENRNYILIGTQLAPQGGTLTQGDSVILDYDALDNSDMYIKVRGINGTVTGPYSPVSGLIEFRPVQTTDAVGTDTKTLDDTGSPITGLLAGNALMWLLNQLMSNNTGSAGILSGLSSLFGISGGDATLVSGTMSNVGAIAGGPSSLVSTMKLSSNIYDGLFNNFPLVGDSTVSSIVKHQITLANVTLPYTGDYRITYNCNWGGNASPPAQGVIKLSEIIVPGVALGGFPDTGDWYVQLYEDHLISGLLSGTAGQTITLKFEYATNVLPSTMGGYASCNILASIDLIP